MYKYLSLFVFIVILFTSCQKELEPLGTVTRIDSASASGKLKRTVAAYGNQQAWVDTFIYDGNNRLTQWKTDDKDSSLANMVTSSSTETFYYIGTNEFPTKCFSWNSNTNLTDTTYYYYDASNRLTREEIFGTMISDTKYEYTYAMGLIIINKYYAYSPAPYALSSTDSLFFDAKKNMTLTKTYDNAGVYNYSYTYSFDAMKNPYANINIIKYINTAGGDATDLMEGRSTNNSIIYSQYQMPGNTLVTSSTRSFSYNASGYPITCPVIDFFANSTPSNFYSTMRFEYF